MSQSFTKMHPTRRQQSGHWAGGWWYWPAGS